MSPEDPVVRCYISGFQICLKKTKGSIAEIDIGRIVTVKGKPTLLGDVQANTFANGLYAQIKSLMSVVGGLFEPNLQVTFVHDRNQPPIRYRYLIIILLNQVVFTYYKNICAIVLDCIQEISHLTNLNKKIGEGFLFDNLDKKLSVYELRKINLRERSKLNQIQNKLIDKIKSNMNYTVEIEYDKDDSGNRGNDSPQGSLGFDKEGAEEEDILGPESEIKPKGLDELPDDSKDNGNGGRSFQPKQKKPAKVYGIETWAEVLKICLTNSRPSEAIEGGHVKKCFFTQKTWRYIWENPLKFANQKKRFYTVESSQDKYVRLTVFQEEVNLS